MCNSVHALRCYSSNPNTGGLGGQADCAAGTPFCYVNIPLENTY
jgi:hypothetical protein